MFTVARITIKKKATIGANVHVARSDLEACDNGIDQVAILQKELDKAFYRVKHDALFDVLERGNIGTVILKGAKMSHRGCTTKLIVNKELTEEINVRSSVRARVPSCLSTFSAPLFFNLYLELFCLSLLGNEDCRGYRLADLEIEIMS